MFSKNVPNAIQNSNLVFKRFSRKKYGAFNTMHRIVHIATLAIGYCLIVTPFRASAQSDSLIFSKIIDLEEVEIVGQSSLGLFNELPRMVSSITSVEIESAPSQSISDLLRYTSNIDIRQRGKFGIQSDISIRGGSFDHNIVLLNGIDISDPQTGHLSFNLPVESDAIHEINILSGTSTHVFGTSAFSGAVNFITRPSDQNSFKIGLTAGSYYTFGSSVTINIASGNTRNLFHYSNGFSKGYAINTDFGKQGFYYHGQIQTGNGQFELQFGHNARSFGANGYYSSKYPDQYENNKLTLFSFGYEAGKIIRVKSNVYWRRHKDRFELFREGRDWYSMENGMAVSNDTTRTQYNSVPWYSGHNHHISDALGAQLSLSTGSKIGKTTMSWNIRSENIISTNIGYDKGIVVPVKAYPDVYYSKSDNRTNFNMHLEQTIEFKPIYISAGILINWNTFLPDKINFFPGIDLRYEVAHFLHLTGSYNYSLGLPTFTDLTYEDASNIGNNELKPYTKRSIEGGIRLLYGSNITTAHAFYEYGEKIIDWVWFVNDNRFKPVNVDEYRSEGIELLSVHSFLQLPSFPFVIRKIRIGYIFINMHKEIPGEVAKYFNLRHKFSGMLQHQITDDLMLSWNFGYHVREGNYLSYDFKEETYEIHDYKPYWLFDVRLSYSWKGFTVYLEATNLFNKKYIDIGSIYQPGRWITGGLKYEFKGF